MDILELISDARTKGGYRAKNYQKYSRYTRMAARKTGVERGSRSPLVLAYFSENALAKHFLAKRRKFARKHIKKARRLCLEIKNAGESAGTPLHLYASALEAAQRGGFCEAVDCLLQARQLCRDVLQMREDIDGLLALCSQETGAQIGRVAKVGRKWLDIELEFEDEEEADLFFSGAKRRIEGEGFASRLKNQILNIEYMKARLFRVLGSESPRPRCIFEKSKRLCDALDLFGAFLRKNYIKSEALSKTAADFRCLSRFFLAVLDKSRGEFRDVDYIAEFCVPVSLAEYRSTIERCRNYEGLAVGDVRRKLMEILSNRVVPRECPHKMPFLPIFYDLASDFVDYPKASKHTSSAQSLISKISSLAFKKRQ